MSVMAARASFGILTLLLPSSLGGPIDGQEGFEKEGFVLIVNAANPGTQMRRESVAAAFLKQATRWGDGSPIAPVDQSTTSPVRKVFTEAVLKQSVASVQNHWMQQIQAGRLPPPVKNSDAEVAAFVSKEKGAIGYVTADFVPPAGTKLIRLAE
jgi:ABC-type phosphate transport system substrate-binding protein